MITTRFQAVFKRACSRSFSAHLVAHFRDQMCDSLKGNSYAAAATFCFILDASCIVKGARIQLVLHRFRNLGNADGRCRRKRVKLCCHALPGASLPSEPASSPRDLLDHFPVGVCKRAKEKPEVHFTIGQTPKCK